MPLLVRMYLEQRDDDKTYFNWKLPSVYQSVQHLSSLLNQVWLIGIILQLIIRLQVEDHVQRLSVVGNLLIETSQVELVLDVVLVHLAEELIAAQTTEPRDPGYLATKNKLNQENYFCFSPPPNWTSSSWETLWPEWGWARDNNSAPESGGNNHEEVSLFFSIWLFIIPETNLRRYTC